MITLIAINRVEEIYSKLFNIYQITVKKIK